MPDINFGPFCLDASATRLVRDGAEVKLRPQALEALRVLLRHQGPFFSLQLADAGVGATIIAHQRAESPPTGDSFLVAQI